MRNWEENFNGFSGVSAVSEDNIVATLVISCIGVEPGDVKGFILSAI